MTTVYLAGPRGETPLKPWRERLIQTQVDVDWINPFEIHSSDASGEDIYRGDLKAVEDADAMLLYYTEAVEICGAYIEAGHAGAAGVPTVVWNDTRTDLPEFLRWHAKAVCETLEAAAQEVSK